MASKVTVTYSKCREKIRASGWQEMAEGSCFCERVVDEVLIGALPDRGRGMVLGTKVVDGDGRLSIFQILECGTFSCVRVSVETFFVVF